MTLLTTLIIHSFLFLGATARPTSTLNSQDAALATTCQNFAFTPFDYSVKPTWLATLPTCSASAGAVEVKNLLMGRQAASDEDYSCDQNRPCSNNACCSKTGWCNYGPEACGTDGISPNEVCWSNCDAKAECGRYSDTGDRECPLNVCCSPFGFCGMTEEFCTESDEEDESCQSNCNQPSSGGSDGNVRKRVIGYYEAWVNNRTCNGMSIAQIPAGALTHLMFSFGYITPGTYDIVPMDGLDSSLLSEMTALKQKNSALKVMIALGGWTFNDPGATQTVFSDVASSSANRSKFIAKLLSFMRQYAFDGVDFDWEYPGAEDRGGNESDGENFTKLLEELKTAIADQPIEYEVSFTTPTSYWYLRHFDLKASAEAVDFVNVMSYDLHGIWDRDNPIGDQVLAHSNLTEIKLALDLYWRNDVDPSKLNLGLGFYGRSFQLSDPTCYEPGCQFKGGASPGSCTDNSGTLAYREIVGIVDKKNLKPYYDEEAQIKYIVWDQDQWVSYDDADTIAAKIDFANEQGLGGLLIWSIDQDTDSLEALEAVVGKQTIALAMKSTVGNDAAYWSGLGDQACYVTDCGGSCKAGYKKVTNQPCGGAKPVTRHSKEADSSLCCPLTSFPEEDTCTWRGEAPSCNGRCHDGEVMLEMNRWGNGKYCEDGNKAYCCETPQGKNNDCYWSGMGNSCKSGDTPLTFAGSWLEDVADVASIFGLVGQFLSDALNDIDASLLEQYCCPKEDLERWNNCEWKGEPGSCFDNHCDAGTQVQMTTNRYGLAESCSPRLERSRVFCCDPPDGEPLFLPVPLEDLFPSPPTGDNVDTDFDLQIDNTWGDGKADTSVDDDPDQAAFKFYVLASPDEIQTSLDKRDGSSWELFNCHDADSLETQTVQMVCWDPSEDSNCNHIYRGDGVAGTIIQMPMDLGCGPGKYAVAVDLVESKNQTMPSHLQKRASGSHGPKVYDLTFNYDFSLVPRAYGQTQLRVDFSNQEGYWDTIVAGTKDSMRKTKRSLADVGGNHRRWLEEEWRDDFHFGALDRAALHKRWFGTDVLDWLKGLLNVNVKVEKRHQYSEQISAILLQEDWTCPISDTITMEARLDAVVTGEIEMSTSFGFTLITTLGPDMNLDNSFLHFNNEGHIEAIFTLDAVAKTTYDSKVFSLNSQPIPIPGGSFVIPGIVTIGPQIDLDAQLKAEVSIEGHIEARVTLADWEIRQTYPEQNDDYEPDAIDPSKRGIDRDGLLSPTFDASVEAYGFVEAHLMPTISFGIAFNEVYGIGKAAAQLAADGWVRMRAKSDIVGGDCTFGYGIDAGVGLKARAVTPTEFPWKGDEISIGGSLEKTLIPSNGDEWQCLTGDNARRSLDAAYGNASIDALARPAMLHRSSGISSASLRKRLVPYNPGLKMLDSDKGCPTEEGTLEELPACSEITAVGDWYETAEYGPFAKRDLQLDYGLADIVNATRDIELAVHDLTSGDSVHSFLEARAPGDRLTKDDIWICGTKTDANAMKVKYPVYAQASVVYDNENWADCDNYNFGIQQAEQNVPGKTAGVSQRYITEHILEAQLIKEMFAESTFTTGGTNSICRRMKNGGWDQVSNAAPFNGKTPLQFVASGYPDQTNYNTEMMRIIEPVNLAKESLFAGKGVIGDRKIEPFTRSEAQVHTAIASFKKALMVYKYLQMQNVNTILVTQATRVADNWEEAENNLGTNFGLKTKWEGFVKRRTQSVITKLENFMTTYIVKIEAVLDGTAATQDNAVNAQTGQALHPGRARRREMIENLRKAYDAAIATPWANPF